MKPALKEQLSQTLDFAIVTVDIQLAKQVLEQGVRINERKQGFSPLLLAIHTGSSELVKLIIDHGADVNLPDSRGVTPLRCAVEILEALPSSDRNISNETDDFEAVRTFFSEFGTGMRKKERNTSHQTSLETDQLRATMEEIVVALKHAGAM